MTFSDEMEPIVTRCGYRCDLCLAYRPNVEREPANRRVLSDGWFAYFGFRIPPEEICCDGCMAEAPALIDTSCPVRPCVLALNLDNCAQCERYPCDKLGERTVIYEQVRDRVGRPIPEEDYQRFIRPYENRRRLDALIPSCPPVSTVLHCTASLDVVPRPHLTAQGAGQTELPPAGAKQEGEP